MKAIRFVLAICVVGGLISCTPSSADAQPGQSTYIVYYRTHAHFSWLAYGTYNNPQAAQNTVNRLQSLRYQTYIGTQFNAGGSSGTHGATRINVYYRINPHQQWILYRTVASLQEANQAAGYLRNSHGYQTYVR